MDEPNNELSSLERIADGRENPRPLELALLRAITDKFSDARIIGHGGCGVVYKGILRNGVVAVKRLHQQHTIDEKMFNREMNSMMEVTHRNIIRFLGYCSDTQGQSLKIGDRRITADVRERLLCFEYISNGSLQNYIKDELRGLKWHHRYQIIMGICEGLHYLHKEKQIIHMDLKPGNILLGDHLVPKITDFGLANVDGKTQTTSTKPLVSLGYCAPEYLHHGRMSAKSDIYSLGVIILELVTGSKGDTNIKRVLQRWRHRWNKSSEHAPLLWYRQVTKCIDLAQWCMRVNPIDRPDISDIIRELNEVDRWNGQTRWSANVSTFDEIMSSMEDMLGIEPLEMHFPFVLNEQISFSIKVTNDTDGYFAFRIETTSLLPLSTQPEKGIVPPRSGLCATIILKARDKPPLQNRCNEFYVQSFRIDGIPTSMDVTGDMFDDKGGKVVDEVNLTVVFDMPPTPEQPQMDTDSTKSQDTDDALENNVPEDPRYKDVYALECVLDGSQTPGPIKLSTLKFITDGFSRSREIGSGDMGAVYKGILRNGIVAVKRLFKSHTFDDKMFRQEVRSMMMVKHQNIVRFLGYCSRTEEEAVKLEGEIIMAEVRERLLCFEYGSNGNLGDHLTDELRGLEWHTRYQILRGICEALNHLHTEKHIIHMNLKPSNILLDDQMIPKVSDFSLSRLVDRSRTMTGRRVFSRTTGECLLSLGYCAPEYVLDARISAKSDIYSLGIVIKELVTGRKDVPNTTNVLRRWRHRWNKSRSNMPLWDHQVTKCLELAESCTRDRPIERPFIWDIIRELDESDKEKHRIRELFPQSKGALSLCLDDMLGIEPLDLHFPFEVNVQLSQTVQLTNDTDHCIAFFMKNISDPFKSLLAFKTEPNKGVVPPRSSCAVTVTMSEQNKIPDLNRSREILMVESTRVEGVTAKDITSDLFEEEDGKVVDRVNLTAMFDIPKLPEEA